MDLRSSTNESFLPRSPVSIPNLNQCTHCPPLRFEIPGEPQQFLQKCHLAIWAGIHET
jgi:hypothetical protein